MKQPRIIRKTADETQATPIKTTFMELIQELGKLTEDDNLVVAAVTHIFSRYKVVATRTLAPVKLLPPLELARLRGNRGRSCWA